ncbi:hypothetical protein MMPV_000394 [Pyropia vietnamensis]
MTSTAVAVPICVPNRVPPSSLGLATVGASSGRLPSVQSVACSVPGGHELCRPSASDAIPVTPLSPASPLTAASWSPPSSMHNGHRRLNDGRRRRGIPSSPTPSVQLLSSALRWQSSALARSPPPDLTLQVSATTSSPLPSPVLSRLPSRSVTGEVNSSVTVGEALEQRRLRRVYFDADDVSFTELASVADDASVGTVQTERPSRAGVSGTYLIRGARSQSVVGVFKPANEEPSDVAGVSGDVPLEDVDPSLPLLSPVTYESELRGSWPEDVSLGLASVPRARVSHRKGLFVKGEGAAKEVAAYLLDHGRFAGVPQTALARCCFFCDDGAPPRERRRFDGQVHQHCREADIVQHENGRRNRITARNISPDLPGLLGHCDLGKALSSAAPISFGTPSMVTLDVPFDDDDDCDDFDDGCSSDASFSTGSSSSQVRNEIGALQVFVPNDGDADDYGPSVLNTEAVHRVALFDLRTLNFDRHGGNLLVTKSPGGTCSKKGVTPIDHGYILPAGVRAAPWPVWMDWPLASEPVSPAIVAYASRLDGSRDAAMLHRETDNGLREGSLRALRYGTLLVKLGIGAGLTLREIGEMVFSRQPENERSPLEVIAMEAEAVTQQRRDRLLGSLLDDVAESDETCSTPPSRSDVTHSGHGGMFLMEDTEAEPFGGLTEAVEVASSPSPLVRSTWQRCLPSADKILAASEVAYEMQVAQRLMHARILRVLDRRERRRKAASSDRRTLATGAA